MKTLGKKTMVLAGAMAFSMAMGTFAYADTKAPEKVESIPAVKCTMAVTAEKADAKTVDMKLINLSDTTALTKIVVDGKEFKIAELVPGQTIKATDAMTMSIKTIPAKVIQK